MMAIRMVYQRKDQVSGGEAAVEPQRVSLLLAAAAALTNIVFGLAYLLRPGAFRWAYGRYPAALRWVGAGLLALGTGLLWAAHHHLAENFSGVVVLRQGQQLVQTGPYAKIRHPIYTAYLLNYVGGGLMSSNWVLTVVPTALYAGMVTLRIPQEEALLQETFAEEFEAYRARTHRLLPW
jgi:protein-S-isoprenylcysteine O-methyltransferase Ste14